MKNKIKFKHFTPLQLADWFRVNNYKCRKADASVGYLTGMKLSCLLYYVQGCMLGAYNQKAFNENIEAWDEPILKSIFNKYGLNKKITTHKFNNLTFINYKLINETYPINRIVRTMGMKLRDYTSLQLKDMIRQEYPYHHAKYMCNNIISPQSIKYYFKKAVIIS